MHQHWAEVKEYTLSAPPSSPHWPQPCGWTCVFLYKHSGFTSVPNSLLGTKPSLMTVDYLVLITTLLLLDSSGALLSPANEHQLLRKSKKKMSHNYYTLSAFQTLMSSGFGKTCIKYMLPSYFLTRAIRALLYLALLETSAVVEISRQHHCRLSGTFLRGASSQFPRLRKNNRFLFVVSGSTQRQKVLKADLKVLLQIARKRKELYKASRKLKNFWK